VKIRIRLFSALILIQALIACALSSASVASTTPPATPVPASPSLASSASRRYFTQTFASDPLDWSLTQTHGDPNLFHAFVEAGRWNFQLDGEYIYAYAIYESVTYHEVQIDARVINQGSSRNLVSLICHFNLDKGWYEFDVSSEGTYRILFAQWDEQTNEVNYSPLADGISAAILPGKVENTFSAICSGTYLVLRVNGIQLIALNDEEYGLNNGKIGIGVSSLDVLPIRLEFDSVSVSQPKK